MWLCIRFPLLPLESLYQSLPTQFSELATDQHSLHSLFITQKTDHSSPPMAVSENHKIICCNDTAQQLGIHKQQSLSTSYTLVDELKVIERQTSQEHDALTHIATVLSLLSPTLHLCYPQCIQIEIGRSLKLFNGLSLLINRVEECLEPLHFTYQWAIALTPKMAEVFSHEHQQDSYQCWHPDTHNLSQKQCLRLLNTIPIEQLFLTEKVKEHIISIGIKYIGELLALPLSSLRKRLGSDTTQYIQQLIGEVPDSPKNFQLPTTFSREIEFVDVIHQRDTLLIPTQRLLNELCYFLRLQQQTAQRLHWVLRDNYHANTAFEVQLAEPNNNPKIFFEITQLKLEHITLTGPIEALSLKVDSFSDVEEHSGSLFLQNESFNEGLNFVSKIRAHLGSERCYWLQQEPEFIPELAHKPLRKSSRNIENKRSTETSKTTVKESNPRPAWLFKQPLKIGELNGDLFWNGRLIIISQEERIAGYWWKKPVSRDYFVAQHTSGSFYWIFFDHNKQQWFVHGIYS